MQEIEIKFPDVDQAELEEKLLQIGAVKTNEFFYKMKAFDFPGWPLAKEKNAWVRLRTDGKETMLSYKQRLGVKSQDASIPDEGMEEIELEVSDFENMTLILSRLGMVEKFYQEKKRTRYKKGDVEFDIDTWPLIPTYLEIESFSIDEIEKAAKEIGFDPKDAKICSASQMFTLYGINDHEYIHIGFDKQIKREVNS